VYVIILYFILHVSIGTATHILTSGYRNRVIEIATRYGLDGSGFEPRLGRGFPYPFRRPTAKLHYMFRPLFASIFRSTRN